MRSRSSRALGLTRTLAVVTILASALATTRDAAAVGTRTFDLATIDDLGAGDLTNVSVDSRGQVRPGLAYGKTAVSDAQTAWGSVLLPDGSILLGTGNEGKIIRVAGGQVEVAATTGQMAVTSLAIAWGGDVVAGSFPNGKLYRLPKGQGKGEAAKEMPTKLEGVEYIWALAYDDKSKSLYAATGPEGKVLRIDDSGKAQVHFDAEDAHITSLALGPDGKVYCGTAGKALLYRIDAPGRAAVVHDFDAEDVSAIAIAKDGTVWAAANKYGGGFSMPGKGGGTGVPGPSYSRPSKAGEGVLYRFVGGVGESMMENRKAHIMALSLSDDGLPYIGLGGDGRIMTVSADHLERVVADTEERQITSLVMSGKKRYFIGSDPVVIHEVTGEGGKDAVWTSKVLDAGLPAEFGQLSWRSDGTGAVELETRTGNTQEPDATWSAWSKPLTTPGKPGSPKGRYAQIRARLSKDAAFGELRFHFVTDNVRAVLTNVSAEGRAQRSGKLQQGLSSSGGKAPKPSSNVSLKWEVDNPDKDELRYRVFYRQEGQTQWRDALKPADVFTRSDLDWDTSSLPEGLYRIRVEATDELVNPPDRITKHELESGLVLVDNTAPLFKSLALNGRKLSGEVADGLGPILRIELSLAGTDDWRPVFPTDGIFDQASEKFDADVSALIPPGSKLVGVRAYDQAGNVVTKELEAK
ncbi:MAG: hypothetical protein IPG04_34885 [Polyangiaceae bacterium]|jgi:hypothetical protein|nr:hypothetical protein [Polyangiaceae bacterium]